MLRKFAVVAGLAAGMMMMPQVADTAEARPGARGKRVRVVHIHRVRPYRVYRPVRVYAAPVVVGGGSCAWLRRKAIQTGAPVWWSRYRACRGY